MKLTPEMAQRYDDGRGTAFSAPCIICGGKFSTCGHWESGESVDVCKQLKALGKDKRDKLKAGKL